jgi:hypothetical protein
MKKASTIFEIIRTVFYDFNSLGLIAMLPMQTYKELKILTIIQNSQTMKILRTRPTYLFINSI